MKTHNIPFSIKKKKKKNTLNYPKFAARDFIQRTQEGVQAALVNQPSVFEPLKVYCICNVDKSL